MSPSPHRTPAPIAAVGIVVLLLALTAAPVATDPIPVFGPRSYERGSGPPAPVTDDFAVRNPAAAYVLRVENGGGDGVSSPGTPATSAVVRLNGAEVMGPRDLKRGVATLEVAVDLETENRISVELRGEPGATVRLCIVRSPLSGTFGPEGGTLTDPGGEWELVVPPGAVGDSRTLTVTQGVAPPGEVPEELAVVGDVLRLEPAGSSFATPLRLRYGYPQGALPEGGIEERLVGFGQLHDDGTASRLEVVVDHGANQAVAALPHFSFVAFLRNRVELVADGTISDPDRVERIALLVAEALADPPPGQTVEEYYAANAALLEPFLDAVETVLGEGFVAGTFPPAVCQTRGCTAVAGCGDLRGLQAAAPWPMLGACPGHAGRSLFLGAQSPVVRWSAAIGMPGVKLPRVASQPVVAADGTVYVGAALWLAAVDPGGTVRWVLPPGGATKGSGMLSTPALAADGTLYAGSQDGNLYAVAADGSEVWRRATGAPVTSSPAVAADGTVYVGSGGTPGGLLAVTADGTPAWSLALGPLSTSSPAIAADGTLVAVTEDGWLVAVDPDGTERWRTAVGGVVDTSPVVAADGALLVASVDGALSAVETDGTLRWRVDLGVEAPSTPALGEDGTVYVGTPGGVLHAVADDGTTAWVRTVGGGGAPAVAVGADGTVYAAWTRGGKCRAKTGSAACAGLTAVAPDGTVLWTAPLPAAAVVSPPSIGDDGTVYVNAGGTIVAVGGDARGGEVCSNGIDDDGDGATDCADADCAGLVCDDGDACTSVDTCSAGVCTAGPPLVCDAGDDCTLDACDPLFGCTSTPVADGAACSDDGDLCTEDLCQTGSCAHPRVADDCGGRECGPSPSGCADCGSCDAGYRCTALGSCLLDLPAGPTLVSAGSGGVRRGESRWPSLSADGRFVAFQSAADDLVADDTNGVEDVFVHDRLSGETVRVSVGPGGTQGDGASVGPSMSADGRHVAFLSQAGNLVAGDVNGVHDVFVHDRQSGETVRASLGSDGAGSTEGANSFSLSGDGLVVAFQSSGADLVVGDDNGASDVFVRDLGRGTTRRVSVDGAGVGGNSHSFSPVLSADGRFTAFLSVATNLVPGDVSTARNLFLHDRLTGGTTRGNVDSSGAAGDGAEVATLSGDGRFVVVSSFDPGLVPGDTNGLVDVFVRDRLTGVTSLVSTDPSGAPADGDSGILILRTSADGRFVAFTSRASNLVPGDGDTDTDLFVHDRLSGETALPVPDLGDRLLTFDLSADGRYLAFATRLPLVPEDVDATRDVYVVANPLAGPAERDCGDGLDDDDDGTADCADPDCGDHPACLGLETLCGDGLDDDGDGLADCADPDCAGRLCAAERVCVAGTCQLPGCGDDAGLQAGAPWPMRGACPSHHGRAPLSAPAAPQLRWTFPADVSVDISSPAVAADGTVYLPSRDGHLYAVAPDGSELWRFAAGDQVLSTPAVATDGTVVVGGADGHLHAIRSDGVERWRFATGGAVVSAPTLAADGTVYVGSDDGHLYALAADGTERWRFATGGNVPSSPALGADGTIYVGSFDGHLYAVAPDGSERWRLATGALVSSPAVGRDGAVYVGSFDGRVYAVNPDGSPRWTGRNHSTAVISSPALGDDGAVYVGGDDGSLWALDPDGSLRWTFPTGRPVKSTPAIGADGTILVTSFDGALHALRPDGSEVWSFLTSGSVLSSPALGADGTVYFGTDLGLVFAVGPAAP